MLQLAAMMLVAAMFSVAAQAAGAATTPKKGTYESCVATATKHGSTPASAAEWCTRHMH